MTSHDGSNRADRCAEGVQAGRDPGRRDPKTVGQLIGLGYDVVVEAGAGTRANFSDAAFEQAGAAVAEPGAARGADIVLKINAPTDEEGRLRPGAILASLISPALDPALVERLTAQGVTAAGGRRAAHLARPVARRAQLDGEHRRIPGRGRGGPRVRQPLHRAGHRGRARCRRPRSSSSAPAWPGSRPSARRAASARSSVPSTPGPRSGSRSSRWAPCSYGSRASSRKGRAPPATPRRWARTSTAAPPSSTPSRPRTSTSSSPRH